MMMSQVAQALGATLHGSDVMMTGVSKDTRDIHAGDLYVALVGERYDGHQFVRGAKTAGAAGALVSRLQNDASINTASQAFPQVKVGDTRLALGQLAAHWRNGWSKNNASAKLIGITGSNGKTSVKEMCREILADFSGTESVLSTAGNLNNDIGLPMMLLELRDQHQFSIIEMGANHVGEIDYLTLIARPDVALVNNAGPAHMEGFGSLENIAKAKAEIYHGLSDDGIAVINQDDAFSALWRERCESKKVIVFSMLDESADVYAEPVSTDRYLIRAGDARAELTLKVPGKHNVMNALAAIAATLPVGVPLSSSVASLSEFENIQGRLTAIRMSSGCRLIDDTYNANPLSVSVAIDVLADIDGNKILVLGDMAELGDDAEKFHAEMGVKAKRAGIDALYATGVLSEKTVASFGENGFYYKDKSSLINALNNALKTDDIVLVKGSRSAAMDEVVEQILARQNNNKRVN